MDIVRSIDNLLTAFVSFFLSHTSTFSVTASPVAAITGTTLYFLHFTSFPYWQTVETSLGCLSFIMSPNDYINDHINDLII